MKKYIITFMFMALVLCAGMMPKSAVAGGCSHGCEYRGTIFTGTRLQFRRFQPVRNTLRLGARIGFRTGLFLTGRPAFPGRRFFF